MAYPTCNNRLVSRALWTRSSYLIFVERLLNSICYLADPYLNTDAGTMSPFEHGEVFVLDDGGEVR